MQWVGGRSHRASRASCITHDAIRMTSTPTTLLVFFSLPSSPQVRFSLQVQVFLLQPPPDPDARRGPWETLARDRLRFARRCALLSPILQPILQPSHRERVWERLQGGESLWGPPSPPPPQDHPADEEPPDRWGNPRTLIWNGNTSMMGGTLHAQSGEGGAT